MRQADRGFIERNQEMLLGVLDRELTAVQKQYMVMHYAQGLSMRDIARQLGVNVSTVSRTIKRGTIKLRRSVEYARKLSA